MNQTSVWAHTLVKNEERYLWFAVTSVIEHIDKLLLWDTGSTDGSLKIEQLLAKKYSRKIIYKQRNVSTPEEFPIVRQEMLDATDSDWFMVLDGDEVWWEDSIKLLIAEINHEGAKKESFVVPMTYPIGDIFHRQDESAGMYNLAGKKGNFSLRAVNRGIPGLSSSKPHGKWGWTDANGNMIQDRDSNKIKFIDAPYMHFSLLPRSGSRQDDTKVMKRAGKLKYEIGRAFPNDYFYPEAFFKDKPDFIPNPWVRMYAGFKFRAFFETPLRKIKRRLLKSSVGY